MKKDKTEDMETESGMSFEMSGGVYANLLLLLFILMLVVIASVG